MNKGYGPLELRFSMYFKIMHNFQGLIDWQKTIGITQHLSQSSATYPKQEKFGRTGQISKSIASILSNLAEGTGTKTKGVSINFLGIASGPSNVLFTQPLVSHSLELVSKKVVEPILNQLIETQKINYSLIKKFTK